MSDASLIDNLFTEEAPLNPVDQFVETQWNFLNDYNNNGYQSQQIKFDTLSLKSSWIDYRGSYFAVPMTATASTGTTASGGPGVNGNWVYYNGAVGYYSALTTSGTAANVGASTGSPVQVVIKNSILSLIAGLTVATGSGQTIVNETVAPLYMNNIRLLVDNAIDWTNAEGAESMFSKDVSFTSGNASITSGTFNTPAVANLTTTTNNAGWVKRFGYLINQVNTYVPAIGAAGAATNAITVSIAFTAILPARLLHDFFEQMDFPMINLRMQINLFTNFISGATSSVGATAFPLAVTPTYAPAVITINGPCRLYYKTLKFSPQVGLQIAERMQKGFNKTVQFLTTDYNTTPIAATGQINYSISAGTVRPVRIWLICPNNTSLTTTTTNAVATAGADPNVFPLVTTGTLNNTNILINRVNYYYNPVAPTSAQDYEAWELFREEMPGYGETNVLSGGLSFSDWLVNYRIYVFNVSRAQSRLKSPNDAVTLDLQTTATVVGASTLIVLVEKTQILKIRMSSSDVEILVGVGAY